MSKSQWITPIKIGTALYIAYVIALCSIKLWDFYGAAHFRYVDVVRYCFEVAPFVFIVIAPLVALLVGYAVWPGNYFTYPWGYRSTWAYVLRVAGVASGVVVAIVAVGALVLCTKATGKGWQEACLVSAYLLVFALNVLGICLISAVVAIVLRAVHPVVGAIVAAFGVYFLIAITINSDSCWVLWPLMSATSESGLFVNWPNVGINIAGNVVAVVVIGALAWWLISPRGVLVDGMKTQWPKYVTSVAVLALGGAAPLAIPMGPEKNDQTICRESAGVPVCVAASDAALLDTIVADVSAVADVVARPVPELTAGLYAAEIISRDQPGEYFYIDRALGRADLTRFVATVFGFNRCAEPTSAAARISEDLTVYYIKQLGLYSQTVANNGGLSVMLSEDGGFFEVSNMFSALTPEEVTAWVRENYPAIAQCEAPVDDLPAKVEVQ